MSRGSAAHLLFVPGGGRTGLGETIRTLVLAQAARERWPAARVGFLTDEEHVRLPSDDFERHTVTGRVSRNVAAVNRLLGELAPDLVVFDGRGQGAQIACASRAGARTVYLAGVPTMRRRAFRWSRLRSLDQIWIRRDIVDPRGDLTLGERLRLRLAARPRAHFVQAISPLPDAGRLKELRSRLGLGADSYLLFAPGGGGYEREGRPVPEIFAEAAGRVHEATGLACVVVLGPLYDGPTSGVADVIAVPALSPHEMIDLVSGAQLVACGGGGLMGQALATGRVCVAAPAGGSDQPGRIARCEEAGLLAASPLAADAIAERALALLADDERRAGIGQRIEQSGLRNGLPHALSLMEGLLAARRPIGELADAQRGGAERSSPS
ncbi:MAG: hypothetical protein ACR2P8_04795 [Myxococcota bacterium]